MSADLVNKLEAASLQDNGPTDDWKSGLKKPAKDGRVQTEVWQYKSLCYNHGINLSLGRHSNEGPRI